MENAVDALKMAGSVFLFLFALSIAMLTFSQARETINILLQNTDKSGFTDEHIGTRDRVENTFYYTNDTTIEKERYVGLETIIPTAYRAAIESFRIDFIFPDDDVYLYMNYNNFKTNLTPGVFGNWEKICYIDIDTVRNVTDAAGSTGTGGNLDSKSNTSGTAVSDSEDFITGILFNKYDDGKNFYSESEARVRKIGRYPFPGNSTTGGYRNLVEYIEHFLNSNPKNRIVEKIGTYYQEDIAATKSLKKDVDKTVRRLVTYEFKTLP